MERGDIVEYNVTGQKGMGGWRHLNGRVGIVTAGPFKPDPLTRGYKQRWEIQWINMGNDGMYPVEFLRKIGHIDLPAEDGGQEGEELSYANRR